ncbi:MAG: hypothetical protein IPP71_05620 [Bacteroidetes bacterium]|nr:hypothetical protein [Bacteroidota bacterium]
MLFLLLCIFTTGSITHAQQLLISPNSIDAITLGYTKVIGQDEDGYFVLMSNLSMNIENDRVGFKSRKYKLTYFNKTLTLKWEKTIESSNSESAIETVTFFNEKVVVISSIYNRNEDKVSYYISTIDPTGALQSIEKPVSSFAPVKTNYEKVKSLFRRVASGWPL